MSDFEDPQVARERLLLALVNLTEIIDSVNRVVKAEADNRLDQTPVLEAEVAVVRLLMYYPDSSMTQISEMLRIAPSAVRAAIRSLQHRGMAEQSPDGTPANIGSGPSRATASQPRFRATPAGYAIRTEARSQAEKQLKVALSGMRFEDQSQLQSAADSLSALGVALGFQPLKTLSTKDPHSHPAV